MGFLLEKINEKDIVAFKKDMQEAFKKGAFEDFGDLDEEVLPEEDIDRSLNSNGAIAYKAVVDGEMVGGTIVVIESNNHNHLDFLFVKYGVQSKGIGKSIWREVEKLHPETKVWETHTPYYEKRNIHFYVNVLGFHIVEFFNPSHKDPKIPDDRLGGEYFFRFEKYMNKL